MPPQLAALIFCGFIVWVFRQDLRWNRGVSRALWVPFTWMALLGSRSAKEWFYGLVSMGGSNAAALSGSNSERIVIVVLTVLGLAILVRRSFSWDSLLTRHLALLLFFFYSLLSISWADAWSSPFLQWNRMFLSLIMVLVVYTDRDPDKAFNVVVSRVAYLLIPLSMLFVKYFPALGRQYSQWGAGQIVGVASSKNSLGLLCMTCGMFFLYSLMAGSRRKGKAPKRERQIAFIILGMTCWLLYHSDTSNALVATVVGSAAIVVMQKPAVRLHFTSLVVVGTVLLGILWITPGFFEFVVGILGEDTTVTGRTDLWADLLAIDINPLIGVGFESFWESSRKDVLWQRYWWLPNQAHNAYIEIYLNMGMLGVGALVAAIVSCFRKTRRQVLVETLESQSTGKDTNDPVGRLRMGYLLALIFYGYAEAVFRPSSFGFFLFLLAAVESTPQEQLRLVRTKWKSVRPRQAATSHPYRYSG